MTWYQVDGTRLGEIHSSTLGLNFRKTPTQDDLDHCAVAPWDSYLLGTEKGDFVKVGQLYLPVYLHGERILVHIEDKKIIEAEALNCYRVSSKAVLCSESQNVKGLEYCKNSTSADCNDTMVAPWGARIWGTDEGDFVKVGREYLPKEWNGELVLVEDDRTEEPIEMIGDMDTALRNMQGEITKMQSESDHFKDVVYLGLFKQNEQIQELLAHLNDTTQRVGRFESCLRKLSGLAVLCKDFEKRLARHEDKLAAAPSKNTDLHSFEDIPEGEEGAEEVPEVEEGAEDIPELKEVAESPKAATIDDQDAQPQSTSHISDSQGAGAKAVLQDIKLQCHDIESNLANHCLSVPDGTSITQSFAYRLEALEKQLRDLAGNQLHQQHAVEAKQIEAPGVVSQLQAEIKDQQRELDPGVMFITASGIKQLQQPVQQLEELLGLRKSFSDKCLRSDNRAYIESEPKTLSASVKQVAQPVSLKATPTMSPRQIPRKLHPGSRPFMLPRGSPSESAVPPSIPVWATVNPSTRTSLDVPRMRSISPKQNEVSMNPSTRASLDVPRMRSTSPPQNQVIATPPVVARNIRALQVSPTRIRRSLPSTLVTPWKAKDA